MKTQSDRVSSQRGEITVRVPSVEEVPWFDGLLAEHHYFWGRPAGGRLPEAGSRAGRPSGGSVGLGTGLLCTQGSGFVDLLERAAKTGAAEAGGAKSPVSGIVEQGERRPIWPRSPWARLCGVLRLNSGRSWLSPAAGREFPTDPEAYEGTCQSQRNWEAVGYSAGYSRHRADFYVANDQGSKSCGCVRLLRGSATGCARRNCPRIAGAGLGGRSPNAAGQRAAKWVRFFFELFAKP